MQLCSIDFSQGDFNQKNNQQNQQGQKNNNQQKKTRQNKPKQSYNVPLDKFRGETVPVFKKDEKGNIELTKKPTGLSKISEEAIEKNIGAQKDEFELRGAKARHEAAPILKAEKRSKAISDIAGKAKDVASSFVKDPGKSIDTAKDKLGEFLAGKPKTLEKDVKVKNKTTGKFDTIAKKGSVVRDKDGKAVMEKEGLIPSLDKAKKQVDDIVSVKATGKESKDLEKKELKGAYKKVGKEISSNISTARDIGVGIKDAINPNAKFKRIAKYGKGGEVSRLGRAISRGDTRLGENWFAKAVGGALQKGGSSAMQRKATKDYERKQTLRSMRGFSEEEMKAYDEIFRSLIEEDFTIAKPGDQAEAPISEAVLKDIIDTNFYEKDDGEEKKYHESIVKGYSFGEKQGRFELLSREIFGEV